MRSTRFIVIAALAFAVGCQQQAGEKQPGATDASPPAQAAPSGDVIARYGGKELRASQIMQEFERLPAPSRTYLNAPERKRQFVENLVLNDLLFEEGKQAGLDRDPEIDRQVTDLRKRLVVQRVMRKYQTPPEVSDEQAKKYYDDNPDLYSTTQIKASHILVKDEATVKEIAAQLKTNPEKFADLAKEKSTDTTSAKKGGELGLFGQGRMVPEFEKAAFKLKPNEISEPVKTQYGWHIITVTERKDGERKPFDQVKEQIKSTLRNKGLQEQTQGHFEELKKNANVQIEDAALEKLAPPPPSATPPAMGHGH